MKYHVFVQIQDTPVTNAIKLLSEQRGKLQISSPRIEEMLKRLTEGYYNNGDTVVTSSMVLFDHLV